MYLHLDYGHDFVPVPPTDTTPAAEKYKENIDQFLQALEAKCTQETLDDAKDFIKTFCTQCDTCCIAEDSALGVWNAITGIYLGKY